MSKVLTSLLVGSHFKVPGKQVLAALPAQTVLRLEHETDNPYDEFVLKVMVAASSIPDSQQDQLASALEGTGHDLADIFAAEEVQLGFVAATGGKPLSKTDYIGNREFLQAMGESSEPCFAKLAFSSKGEPLVVLTVK